MATTPRLAQTLFFAIQAAIFVLVAGTNGWVFVGYGTGLLLLDAAVCKNWDFALRRTGWRKTAILGIFVLSPIALFAAVFLVGYVVGLANSP